MKHKTSPDTIYIPLQTVTKLINLSASSIRRLEIIGDFPRKRRLAARRIGYVLDEVKTWAENRAKV